MLVTISPLETLFSVTVCADGVAICEGTLNPEDGVDSLGSPTLAEGTSLELEGGRLVKSWVFPIVMAGAGFAD